jgi:hypothetical protein
MTPTDDDVIARLRASLKVTADRTPISAGRFAELDALPAQSHGRAVVTVFSAAAAVAAIAGVTAVVATHGTHPTGVVQPAATGKLTPTPSPVPSSAGQPGAGSTSPLRSACSPENYYVTASASQLTGLTYMLPATPAGYVLYGAWGTISRNLCADSVTWYVEYDPVGGAPGSGSGALQLAVTRAGDPEVAPQSGSPAKDLAGYSDATPVAAAPVRIGAVLGTVIEKDSSYALIDWTTGGAQISLAGPVTGGDVARLLQVANSVELVSPGDARIVAPADCQVPPGSVCGSDSATPVPTASVTPSPTPTSTPEPTSSPTPTSTVTPTNMPTPSATR